VDILMKRFSLFLITTLLLTGCSSAQEEIEIQTKIQTESQSSTEVEQETKSAEKVGTSTKPESKTKSERQSEKMSMNTAILKTSMGQITIELFPNQAPKTVKNFVDLATGAKEWTDPNVGEKVKTKLYDGTIFHRVIPGFMIQGGDPLGSGMGGPGYNFADEFHGELSFDKPYLLAMANAGPNTNGSQFFITVTATTWLNRKHTIFGQVSDPASQKVIDAIATVKTGANDKPVQAVKIESVTIK
jgi:peptidyl-prolyl cis-trans isomerase A (cyclophilin A)